jgi:hypothetical protein
MVSVRGVGVRLTSVNAVSVLAATHDITLNLCGPGGTYLVDHRTSGPPEDATLVAMVHAARRSYELLHGAAPDEINVCVVLLPLAERQSERRYVESELAPLEPDDLGLEEFDDIGFFESDD